ncbi:hypothetical protein [Bifidobacterium simiarum]|uniref:hypothetical protein n=1 Tax=Bifidobacterium simiarum TaxID=2045441 RepID=UPI001BDBF958|nr:hypothetical protein [Bifidobacterium simiarum]MBT1165584.1 hypothetical protein [Bifidobacterium simiarum]
MTAKKTVKAHPSRTDRNLYVPCNDPECRYPHVTFASLATLLAFNMLADSCGWKLVGGRIQPQTEKGRKALLRIVQGPEMRHVAEVPQGCSVLLDEPQVSVDTLFDAYAAAEFRKPGYLMRNVSECEWLVRHVRSQRIATVSKTMGCSGLPFEMLVEELTDFFLSRGMKDQSDQEEAVLQILSLVAPELVHADDASLDKAMKEFAAGTVDVNGIRMAACALGRLNTTASRRSARYLITDSKLHLQKRSSSRLLMDYEIDQWHDRLRWYVEGRLKLGFTPEETTKYLPDGKGREHYWLFGFSTIDCCYFENTRIVDTRYLKGRSPSLLRRYLTNVYYNPGNVRYLAYRGTEYTLKQCRNPKTKQKFTAQEAALLGTLLDSRTEAGYQLPSAWRKAA